MKEKSEFEKRTAEKQVSLLTEALTSAVDAKGHWLNASGKLYPKLYPKGFSVSPFNALVLALDSDAKGCKSNLFTQFSEAKARGESVREHEKGVPFLYYNWNKYVNRNNPDDVITKEAYAELSEQDKQQYKGVKNREIRVLFNIDQTLLPMANETAYTTALKKDGTVEDRGYGDKEDKQLHGCVNGFLQKMKDNLVNVRQDGTGVAHYDTEKDVIYLPRQRDFEHYNDYVQEMMRQLVSATGHQQRLAREGMVMKNGKAPSEDAVKKERLITEIASGVKMLELGLPARLSKDSLSMVDYWTRELKEDPCLIDAIESEVNGALKVLKKAELGEKVEYATDQHQRETAQIQVQLPNHYFVADEIKQHPNEEQRTVVIVRDDASKTADVVLPQGASLEVNNEIKGMNKQRFTNALQKEGYDNVRFYNPDGALGFRPDDSYFADKKITVSRLRNWSIEDLSSLDASEAVTHSRDIGFDNVQLVKDDKERWALYIKPEGKEGFAVYPDKGDLNHFFTTLKQSMDNIERVREELAQKYYAMAEAKPDLKVDIFGGNEQEVDLNRIQRVAVFRAKSGECLCAATIDGKKLQPRSVSPSQWQRLWVAPDRDSYKQNLAASLFADVLQKDNNVEQSTQEKQEEVLITSDVGVDTTLKIISRIEDRVARDKYVTTSELTAILREEIASLLTENHTEDLESFTVPEDKKPYVIMVVGVNGVGKTTTIGKLAYQFKKAGKNVYLGAADTFRAAAVEQLVIWSERVGVPIVKQKMGSDPASVAFDTLSSAKANGADVVIIDTAGRLHNKINLMNELTKIKNVMKKVVPDAPHEVLLVLDGSTGQNAFEQAKQFTAATEVNALAVTKLDGTAKGGVVIGISDHFRIPVKYIGLGEGMEDLQVFNRKEFVNSLFGE